MVDPRDLVRRIAAQDKDFHGLGENPVLHLSHKKGNGLRGPWRLPYQTLFLDQVLFMPERMKEIDERNLSNRTRKERTKNDKTLMRTNNVKAPFLLDPLAFCVGILDFAKKEFESFSSWKIESVQE
jgi:hypothetical protein